MQNCDSGNLRGWGRKAMLPEPAMTNYARNRQNVYRFPAMSNQPKMNPPDGPV